MVTNVYFLHFFKTYSGHCGQMGAVVKQLGSCVSEIEVSMEHASVNSHDMTIGEWAPLAVLRVSKRKSWISWLGLARVD